MGYKVFGAIMIVCIVGILTLACGPARYTLKTTIIPEGEGTINPAGGKYEAGTEVTITAIPASGYAFDHWSGDASGTNSTITIPMTNDKNLVAHFTNSIYQIFSFMCDPSHKDGVSAASTYDKHTTGPHPIVLLTADGKKHTWNDELRSNWRPNSVGSTQLVACLGEEEVTRIQKCDYTSTPIGGAVVAHYSRFQYYIDVRLFSANTGDIISAENVNGTYPGECPLMTSGDQSRYGDHVSFLDVEAWLSRFVNNSFYLPQTKLKGESGRIWPESLTFDGTYLWISSDDTVGGPAKTTSIRKLDTTGNIIDSFSAPGESIYGLAFDGTFVWASDYYHRTLYKLDTNGNVVSSFHVKPKIYGLAFDGRHLWGSDHNDYKIHELDMQGNVISSFDTSRTIGIVSVGDLTFDGAYLWALVPEDMMIYKLDTKGNVISSFRTICETFGLAFDGTYVWAGDKEVGGMLYQIDIK